MNRSLRLLGVPIVLVGLVVLLSGCSGLALLAAWDKWFADDDNSASSYHVYLDGYDLAVAASVNGVFTLAGVSEGDYLVTVAQPPGMRRGLHATVHIVPGRSFSLRSENPFEGGVIKGTVRRDSSSGALMSGVRVIAVRNGALLLTNSAPLTFPQAAGTSMDYMMGFTDSSGAYTLGPAQYGNWLVFAAAAGYAADAKYLAVQSGKDGTAALVLTTDSAASTGVVRSSITNRSGSSLSEPLLTATLSTPFEPTITAATRTAVASASGLTLPAGVWFRLDKLATIGSTAGQCLLDLPVGTHSIEGFKYGYKAASEQAIVTSGGVTTKDFSLVQN